MLLVAFYPDFDWCQTGSWTFWWLVEDGWGNRERILQVKKNKQASVKTVAGKN